MGLKCSFKFLARVALAGRQWLLARWHQGHQRPAACSCPWSSSSARPSAWPSSLTSHPACRAKPGVANRAGGLPLPRWPRVHPALDSDSQIRMPMGARKVLRVSTAHRRRRPTRMLPYDLAAAPAARLLCHCHPEVRIVQKLGHQRLVERSVLVERRRNCHRADERRLPFGGDR